MLEGLPGATRDASGRVVAPDLAVLDAGAGTGISSRALAHRGCDVTALEPNADMAANAASHGRVRFVIAPAERSRLADGLFRLVLAAQSFHWLDHGPALDEFARVLARPGRIALMWNVRDGDDPFMQQYEKLVEEHAIAPVASPWATGLDAAVLLRERFGNARVRTFAHADRLSLPASLTRARSASYNPNSGDAGDRFAEALMRLARSFADQDGLVRWSYRTELFTSDL
jgi:SAM-dependent methyltransferase